MYPMKTRIWTSVLAIAATVLGLSATAQAQPWMEQNAGHSDMPMAHKSGDPHLAQMAKKLGLSAEQQKQIQALHAGQQDAMRSQREQSKKLQAARSAAWAAATLDAARLEDLRQQEIKQFDAMSKLRLEHQLALAKILTPTQRQQMADWQKARHAHQARQQQRGEDPTQEQSPPQHN
jgi:Spy/CpxP family protein refolding chaperone